MFLNVNSILEDEKSHYKSAGVRSGWGPCKGKEVVEFPEGCLRSVESTLEPS